MTGIELLPLIKTFGYAGIFSAILLENSIPFLFFVPGDTLLLTAGFLAAQGYLEIEFLLIGGLIAAILGYMLGYLFGSRLGRKVFESGGTKFIKTEHLEKTKDFYNKYGSHSIFIARFLPLRACVVFVAGAVHMPYRTFMLYNVISAVGWAVLLPLGGYFLGHLIPVEDIKKLALIPILGTVFIIIMVPAFIHFLHRQKKKTG